MYEAAADVTARAKDAGEFLKCAGALVHEVYPALARRAGLGAAGQPAVAGADVGRGTHNVEMMQPDIQRGLWQSMTVVRSPHAIGGAVLQPQMLSCI